MMIVQLIEHLQTALDRYGDREVVGTYESIQQPIRVIYIAKDTRLYLDVDDGWYTKEYIHKDLPSAMIYQEEGYGE